VHRMGGDTDGGRRVRRCPVLVRRGLCVSLCVLLWPAGAGASVTHKFLPELSAKLTKGAPAEGPAKEPVAVPGPLVGVNALTVDSGHVWAAELLSTGTTRVDEFDAASGAFLRQLNEQEGVGVLQNGVAVGHRFGKEVVYVGAGREGRNVLAAFGPLALQVWSGEHVPGGAFGAIQGVAVDASANLETQGDVFVASLGPGVVDVFEPVSGGGEPAGVLGQIAGTGAAGTGHLTSGSSTVESLLTETGEFLVGQEVIAAGIPAGTTITAATAGSLTLSKKATASGPVSLTAHGALLPHGVAVSPLNADVFVSDGPEELCALGKSEQCGVDVFEPAPGLPGSYVFAFMIKGTPLGPFKRLGAVTVDGGSGNVYVAEKQSNVVDEFAPDGTYRGRLAKTQTGPFKLVNSVAVDPVAHGVFVGDFDLTAQVGAIDAFGPDLTIPDVETLSTSAIGAEGEQLNGTVDPREAQTGEAATCRFVWGTSETLSESSPCEPPTVTGSTAAPVKTALGKLQPGTTYFYRLQASNANGTNLGDELPLECEGKRSSAACFLTLGPGLHAEWASEPSSSSVTLNAEVNPHGVATEVFFEYGQDTSYGSVVPQPGEAIGAGTEDVHAEGHAQVLLPEAEYHYRAVAVSEVEGVVKHFPGPDRTFTTQRAGGGLVLPDGRQWELVSPPDKHGSLLQAITEHGLSQASASGDAVSYFGNVPTEENPQGYLLQQQILSTRGPAGWSSKELTLPHVDAPGPTSREYNFFSPDLTKALAEPTSAGEFTSLAPEAFPPDTDFTPYVRHNATCASTRATCFEPILTAAPGYADVPAGTHFGGGAELGVGTFDKAIFVGSTPDLEHVILSSTVALTETPTNARRHLYEWSAARPPSKQIQPVSVLPQHEGGGPSRNAAHLGIQDQDTRNAISGDGSRVFWSEEGGGLYVRDTAKEATLRLDIPESGCGECGAGQPHPLFQFASRDGSRVFFTDAQRLTSASGRLPQATDLYECEIAEVAGELHCRLRDLTPEGPGGAADVKGALLGASEDGSSIYFAANGALAAGAHPGTCTEQVNAAPAGATCNLYAIHYDGSGWQPPTLVAVLAGADAPDWAEGIVMARSTARVSADGRWLAFMSQRALTGYDNRDAVSGKPDEEVYLYHAAAAGGAGTLVCASCNPTGARPLGRETPSKGTFSLAFSEQAVWGQGRWAAANVPGWTPFSTEEALYQSRYLSEEGRLFFNSTDALVPQDVNGNEDVYEFEPGGVGSCTTSSATFHQTSGGCVSLVSSGVAAGESAFLDASENGNDVFFLTGARLVGNDVDSALDLYDAHVCSTAVPCLSSSSSPPPCVTADACRAAPSPQPEVFGTPPSATFSGPGNLASPPAPTGSVLSSVQRLKSALKACHRIHSRHRRRSCEASARRRFAPARKSAATRAHRRSA
jgi:hypothetical protein